MRYLLPNQTTTDNINQSDNANHSDGGSGNGGRGRDGGSGSSSGGGVSLSSCTVRLESISDELSLNTNYSYTLQITTVAATPGCVITAASAYGAMYAFETFTQLTRRPSTNGSTAATAAAATSAASVAAATAAVNESSASSTSGGSDSGRAGASVPYLPHATVLIDDYPMYRHRSLLIDAGRRFWPVPLIKDVLDTMSFVKMNVLLLHAVDFCRFGIESKLYPALLGNCSSNSSNARCLRNESGSSFAGYYSQDEIKDLVVYAHDRGIRIIPEIEQPEHAYGYDPLVRICPLCLPCLASPYLYTPTAVVGTDMI